ncbi:MAG: sulfotransferase domain-containing protein [Flavobacteriales bacterium]
MLVDNIIIGAGRSGTTSLVEYLNQHPEINFSTIKEVTYFSVEEHFKRGREYLHSFFENRKGILSTSDTYLFMDADAPEKIQKYNPDIKLIVILRDPAKRTFSNFQYSINNGYISEKTSFIESESLEPAYLKTKDIVFQNNHCNFYGSLYHHHLTNWLKYFKKEQLFICTTNELNKTPKETLNKLFEFLGLDKFEIVPLTEKNKASGVKNKGLNNFLINRDNWLRKLIRKPLQIGFVRSFIFKTGVVEKIKEVNRTEQVYREMTEKEKDFCKTYFKQDLIRLKQDFGIEF